MKLCPLGKIAGTLILLLIVASAAHAVTFHAVSMRAGYVYQVDYDVGTSSITSSLVRQLDSFNPGFYYGAMDRGSDGLLYVSYGTGYSGYTASNYGSLRRLAADTFAPQAAYNGSGKLMYMSRGTSAGLAMYGGNNSFYVGAGEKYVYDGSTVAYRNAVYRSRIGWGTAFTYYDPNGSSATQAPIQGLQMWGDTLWALTAPTGSDELHLCALSHGTSNNSPYTLGAAFDAGGFLGNPTADAIGDLAIIEDCMFAVVANQLYVYHMAGGAGQLWTHLGEIPAAPNYSGSYFNYFSGLAAMPDQSAASFLQGPGGVVPEPLTLTGFLLGFAGIGRYVQRRRSRTGSTRRDIP